MNNSSKRNYVPHKSQKVFKKLIKKTILVNKSYFFSSLRKLSSHYHHWNVIRFGMTSRWFLKKKNVISLAKVPGFEIIFLGISLFFKYLLLNRTRGWKYSNTYQLHIILLFDIKTLLITLIKFKYGSYVTLIRAKYKTQNALVKCSAGKPFGIKGHCTPLLLA